MLLIEWGSLFNGVLNMTQSNMLALVLRAEFAPREGYKISEAEKRTHKVREGNKVWRHPKISLERVPIPEVRRPDDVLIRIKAVGICGSDLHFVETDEDGYMIYPGLVRTPVIIGHEFAGIVERVGSGVRRVKPGDMVTSEEML